MVGLDDLRTFLLADATVAGIVSADVYPAGEVPQDQDPPLLILQRIAHTPDYHHRGVMGVDWTTWQISAYTARQALRETLDAALRSRLETYEGAIGDVSDCGIFVDSVLETFEPPKDGGPKGDLKTVWTISVWAHRE